MTNQLDLFQSRKNRDNGIERAIEHANRVNGNWSEQAYQFLLEYIKDREEFITEDVRQAAIDHVPQPPNQKAWGGVIVRAKKSGLITRKGYVSRKNPIAHCATVTLWEVLK
jgi:hypothetical protein